MANAHAELLKALNENEPSSTEAFAEIEAFAQIANDLLVAVKKLKSGLTCDAGKSTKEEEIEEQSGDLFLNELGKRRMPQMIDSEPHSGNIATARTLRNDAIIRGDADAVQEMSLRMEAATAKRKGCVGAIF